MIDQAWDKLVKRWVRNSLYYYRAKDYLEYRPSWLGRWLPLVFRRYVPVRWLGSWVLPKNTL